MIIQIQNKNRDVLCSYEVKSVNEAVERSFTLLQNELIEFDIETLKIINENRIDFLQKMKQNIEKINMFAGFCQVNSEMWKLEEKNKYCYITY